MRTRCGTGKCRYDSRLEAAQALQSCREKQREERAYYRCKHCGGWHLTSQDPATVGLVWSPERGVEYQ